MSADLLPSLLITPDQRRRLTQHFDEAQRLAARPAADYARIHELLAECVRADPGNILYLDALLANLRKREEAAKHRPWWRRLFGGWRRKPARSRDEHGAAVAVGEARPSTEHAVLSTRDSGLRTQDSGLRTQDSGLRTHDSRLRSAPAVLWRSANDCQPLRQLAEAAAACDFDEVELRYLTAARALAPDDGQTLVALARALTRQGRFEDATGPWFAVAALEPENAEALQAIEDLRGLATGAAQHAPDDSVPEDSSHNVEKLLNQARTARDVHDFAAAERHLAHAQAAAGGDLSVLHEREEVRLEQSRHRLAIARQRAASDPHPRAQSLVARMEAEHNRLEAEILNLRVERLPSSVELRLQLARRLKQAGNYSGATQRLDEALRLQPANAAVLIELGECRQRLRQFAKAFEYYEQAVTTAVAANDRTLAGYRSAVLAASLGKIALARDRLAAVIEADPAYKDARERLDKLRQS